MSLTSKGVINGSNWLRFRWRGGLVVSSVASHLENICVEFACFVCACVAFLWASMWPFSR